jgi:hypothetical protein
MSSERSILERLAKPATRGQRTLNENTHEITRSVLRNLQHILYRLGDAPAQPDLGHALPVGDHSGAPDAINLVMRNLRACIEKYEPRLSSIDIAHVEAGDEIPPSGSGSPPAFVSEGRDHDQLRHGRQSRRPHSSFHLSVTRVQQVLSG